MISSSTLMLIVLVLIACVAAIAIMQKREQEKALLRQKIAQYRYRANQAISILGNFSQTPIGAEARFILMQYALANLKAITKLSTADAKLQASIEQLQTNIQSPQSPVDNQRLVIPGDLAQITRQVNNLSTLAKFILKLHKSNMAQAGKVSPAVNRIMSLISESKICAYIQQGKEALSKHEYVPAQRSFIVAQQMLHKITNKNERLTQLEVELQELIKSSPSQAMNTELTLNSGEDSEQQNAHSENHEEKDDNLFGPRKKW